MINKNIIIASDHAGFDLKFKVLEYYKNSSFKLLDLGPFDNNSVDYPDFAHKLCEKMNLESNSTGILICGSGIGMSMVANRYEKIRAALCLNEKMSELSRQHNDANVIVLGSRLISSDKAIKCINSFINTQFEAGRHINRIEKINNKL